MVKCQDNKQKITTQQIAKLQVTITKKITGAPNLQNFLVNFPNI